jgi:SRSO17 transposase
VRIGYKRSLSLTIPREKPLLDGHQWSRLKPELDRYLDAFAPHFGPSANRSHARRFVHGLRHGGERRNTENIAQAMEGGPVRSLPSFITTGAWDAATVRIQRRRLRRAELADDDAAIHADETGFPKKGTKSVGVKRPYSGTLGRTDHGQIGVFLNYRSAKGHSFLDRRRFLPQEWADDPQRREAAGVPESVIFRTKPQLALEMVAQAVAEGIPFRWVGGDGVDGDRPDVVRGVRQLQKWYVVDSSADARVWTKEPRVIPADERPRRGGRPCTPPLVEGESRRVDAVVAALPANAWRRMSVGEGSPGPRWDEYAQVGVWFREEGLPGPRERLLVRRSLGQNAEVKYHRSNAPAEVALEKWADVRGRRWTIAEDIPCGQGECGLDEYETRGWLGWHPPPALSLMALAFLVLQKRQWGEKRAARHGAGSSGTAPAPARSPGPEGRVDPRVVPVATATTSPGRAEPSKEKSGRAKADAK